MFDVVYVKTLSVFPILAVLMLLAILIAEPVLHPSTSQEAVAEQIMAQIDPCQVNLTSYDPIYEITDE